MLVSPLLLVALFFIASLEFSALGVLFSAVPTDTPADVIMISNAIKLPLIFISGIFIPVSQMPGWIKPISLASPLTYVAAAIRLLYVGKATLTAGLDMLITVLYTAFFIMAAVKSHKKMIALRLQF